MNYKEQSDAHKAETLADNLDFQLAALKEATERDGVDLYNLKQVQTRTFEYIEACKSAAAFPSVMGLAVYGFGLSRQRLNQFLRDHPGEASAEFVERVKDAFADTLVNQSLYRNADATQVIFQLKNCNNFSDRLEIEPVQPQDGPSALCRIKLLWKPELMAVLSLMMKNDFIGDKNGFKKCKSPLSN